MGPQCLKLNLDEKPVIRNIGFNIHGRLAVERFTMQGLWSFHLYRWTGALEFRGQTYPIRPGCASLAPPNTLLTWRFPRTDAAHFFVHFAAGRPHRQAAEFPVMRDLGADFAAIWKECEELIDLHRRQPLRAEIRFWDLLLRLSHRPREEKPPEVVGGFPLKTALAILDNELSHAHSVTELARRVGVSRNHLTRLFRKNLQMTAVGYLQGRRMAHVRHLIEDTCLPIKLIAEEVGLSDLQQFNKFFKKRTGVSPRAYRTQYSQRTGGTPKWHAAYRVAVLGGCDPKCRSMVG